MIPYAGASVMAYAPLKKYMAKNKKICFLEMAGRGERGNEPFARSVEQVVDEFDEKIQHETQGNDYSLFGHSMGSLIAYELYYHLKDNGQIPKRLILSGRIPPWLLRNIKKVSRMPEKEFLEEVSLYGGMPREILESKELCEYFIPILRADFRLLEDYLYHTHSNLIESDLEVWYGRDDLTAPFEKMKEWRKIAGKSFRCREYTGNHFYLLNHENMKQVANCLSGID